MMPKRCKASRSNVEALVCIHVLVVGLRLEITIFVRKFPFKLLVSIEYSVKYERIRGKNMATNN